MFAQDIEFKPDQLTSPAGDIGIFIGNDDLVRHNFSIDELDVDEELPSKAYVRIALDDVEPGTYTYYCNIEGHEDMKGTLTVQ
jgi:plastocyanin